MVLQGGKMDVFERLANELSTLPERIQQAYEEASIRQVDIEANKLASFYVKNSESTTLNKQMYNKSSYLKGKYYIRTIDWDDNTPVNTLLGKGWGRDRNKPRAKGKRNYSIRPATSHDLAYIINYGHTDSKTQKYIAGNSFITRGLRRIKGWQKRRDILFKTKLDIIGKSLE